MGYIRGEVRQQTTMFPVTLDEFIPGDHVCRVTETFVDRLEMGQLGFVPAEAAETGRPVYDARDLLKALSVRMLHQVWSSRRLEAECRRSGGVGRVCSEIPLYPGANGSPIGTFMTKFSNACSGAPHRT